MTPPSGAACALLFLFLLISSAEGFAANPGDQQTPDPLHGVVYSGDEVERAVIGALVTIVELQRRIRTDRGGRFRFTDVPDGAYTVRVQMHGYAAAERPVTVGPAGTQLSVALIPTPFELEEVIATASPLGSATGYQAAQAFGREALQRRAATSVGEMLEGEVGVAMRYFGPVPARPVLRGLDGDRVLVLENGERMGDLQEAAADHAISADPLAIDRIEVVRGPASLLYGSSALTGVINLLNDDLPREWSHGTSGNVALQGATVNRLGAGFGRVQHGTDRWAATGRFSYREAGDVMTPEGTLPDTHIRAFAGAAGFGYAGTAFDGALSLDVLENSYGIPEAIHDPGESVQIRMARQALHGGAGWRIGAYLEDVELRLSASRFDQQEVEMEWDDGEFGEEIGLEWLQHSLSSTLTLRTAPLGVFDPGATGFSLFIRDLEVGGEEAFMPSSRSTSLAVFTFQEVPVAPGVRVQVGGRVQNDWTRPLPDEHHGLVADQRTRLNVSGALGINVRPQSGFEIGAQIARAHRTPSARELFAAGPDIGTGTFEIGDPTLDTEIGHGADAFARWTSARTRLEVAGFVNRIDRYIVFQPTGDVHVGTGLPIFHYEGDDAQLIGGEAVLETLFTDALRATAAADYVRGNRRDAAGTALPFIPPVRGRFALTYSPLRWWVGGEVRMVAAQDRVAPEEDRSPGYGVVNFDVGYRFDASGRHVARLRLDNALNTAYRDHLSRVEERGFPMPGRNLNLVYSWMF